jgi:hypothetical protein
MERDHKPRVALPSAEYLEKLRFARECNETGQWAEADHAFLASRRRFPKVTDVLARS